MYNGAPFPEDTINALSGAQPVSAGQNPQTQALLSAISGQKAPSLPAPPVNTGAWPVPDAMAGSESMEPTTAPMGQKPWGMMTPEEGRAEVAASLPGRTQDVAARKAEAARAGALSPEAPALSFMGMPVMGAGEAQEATGAKLAEAEAKKAHAEAQLAGEADLPTTTPLRNAAERAFQSAGTSYTDVPKFTGYIGGWLANEAGLNVSPTDNAVFRLGDNAEKWVKNAFPGDPERQDELGSKTAHMIGFLGALYGPGGINAMAKGGTELAAKVGAAVERGSQAAIAASTGGMGQFEGATAAMEAGQPVTERDRAMATLLGAGVGLTGLIPMASTMATAGEKEAGAIMAEALKGSGVNASQMAAFNVLNNAIAREYYDPKRPLTQGMESDVGLGALVGGATHGMAAAGGPKRLSTPEEVHSFIEQARRSDPDPAKADYWRGMHEMAEHKLPQLPAPSSPEAAVGEAPPEPHGPTAPEEPAAPNIVKTPNDNGFTLEIPSDNPKSPIARAEVTHDSYRPGKSSVGNVWVRDDMRRQGIASKLYDHAENELGKEDRTLVPSNSLKQAGFDFWRARNPEAVAHDIRSYEPQIRQWAKSEHGPDASVAFREGGSQATVFNSEGRRIADLDAEGLKEAGVIPGGTAAYALRGFHNPATRAIEESKQGSMPGDQWLKMLQGAGQKGVQKRHLEELGVPDFLEGKGKVTKQELLDHMRINEAPLEEKIHEDLTPEDREFQRKWDDVPVSQTPPDIESKSPKFYGHSPFPSGENPREFVIRDPRFKGQYDEPHFGGPAALHIRTWDLDGPNGEKILGVGEIQSTAHQKGRQEGYDVRFTEEDEDRLKELGPIRDRLEQEYNATPNYDELSSEEKSKLYQPLRDVYNEIDRLDKLQGSHPVPKMALSDSWLDVGMKRALQYAAENGYDGVTWAKSGQIGPAVGAEPESLATDYDKKIPSWFQKIAKKYGADTGAVTVEKPENPRELERANRLAEMMGTSPIVRELHPGQQNTFIHINDKMRDDIMAKGMPLAMAPDRVMEMMESTLKAGKPVDISTSAINQVHEAIAPMRHVVPESTSIHVLSRIEPHEGKLLGTFTDQDGKSYQLLGDAFSDFSSLRGFSADDGAKIGIANVGSGKRAREVMPASAGEIGTNDPHTGVLFHEGVHSLYRQGLIPVDDWSKLSQHASSFNLMDMPVSEYLTHIGEKGNPHDDFSLKDIYTETYKDLPAEKAKSLIEEEEPVAHMMELFHHGYFKGEEMAPIADLIHKFVSGGYAKGAEPSVEPKNTQKIGSVLDLGQAAHDNWFENSRVVDSKGNPKTVYHGTAHGGFGEFDTYGSKYGLMGLGSYFTEDPSIASEYSDKGASSMRRKGNEPSTAVYPVELSIQSPIDMDKPPRPEDWAKAYHEYVSEDDLADAKTNEDAYRIVEEVLKDEMITASSAAEIMQDGLMSMGYDGITHIGGGRVDPNGVKHRVWIAFHPEQIKSKFNRGTYDPENPDISYALRGHGQSLEDIQGALEGKVKALYGSEFPKKDPEDFGTHGWWALGEGKSSYGDKEVLDRVREKYPDLVGKYKEAYKAERDSRLNDVLGKAAE
jgi:predicted GNAT family acetyltransferase